MGEVMFFAERRIADQLRIPNIDLADKVLNCLDNMRKFDFLDLTPLPVSIDNLEYGKLLLEHYKNGINVN